jgi:hypothetical protein
MAEILSNREYASLLDTRLRHPEAVAKAATERSRRALVSEQGTLFLIAADHPARGQLAVGPDAMIMADRQGLLRRLLIALSRPGVDGILATADIVEDLLLLGALHDRVVIGSMNRGGLLGAAFEMDDRFTGYSVARILAGGLDGGKMLLRLDETSAGSGSTLEACSRAVSDLGSAGLMALVEPLPVVRRNGMLRLDAQPDQVARAIGIASGLGATSAYTWLKVPVVAEMDRVMTATTLPAVILGGDVDPSVDPDARGWEMALAAGNVRGIVAGRTMLYPADGDVAAAVDHAAELLAAARRPESVPC